MLQDALNLVKYKIPVFPIHSPVVSQGRTKCSCLADSCNSPAKHPRTPNGLKDATNSLDRVQEWWAQWPDANIGVPTGRVSGIVVVDVDDPSALADDIDLPYTVKIRTGRGFHLWYKYPGDLSLAVATRKLGPGLDLRSDGAYVLGPGSTHITGVVYETEDTSAPLADLPDWILENQAAEREHKPSLDHAAPIRNGERNNTLFKEACSLRGKGYTESVILAALQEMNRERCRPPLPQSELTILVESASKYQANEDLKTKEASGDGVNPLIRELTDEAPVVSWILPEIIPHGTLIALAGMPGAGKSYLSYTLGLALASGIPVLGQTPERQSKVLYFDQENSYHDRVQYERWAYAGLDNPNIDALGQNFWCFPFILGSADWYARAKAEIVAHKPDLIIFDTATPCFRIEDENDNAEAAIVIGKIRQLMSLTTPKAAAIVLKHAKIQPEKGDYTLRGAKAWEGQVDGIIYQTMGEGRPRKDGLKNTALNPSKTRAFGLRNKLNIIPSWVGEKAGIKLEVMVRAGD